MRIVYPPEDYSTWEESTFLLGSVNSGSTLAINDEEIPVSSRGFFAWKVPLSYGENLFELKEHSSDGEIELKTLRVTCKEKLNLTDLPEDYRALLPFVIPNQDIGVQPGDTVLLVCPAPKGTKVTCRIDGIIHRDIEMSSLNSPIDNREGLFGQLHQLVPPWPQGEIHVAHVHIPVNTAPLTSLAVHFTLQKDGKELEFTSYGSVTVLPSGRRFYGKIIRNDASARTYPVKGSRKTPILKGTIVEISGFRGDCQRVKYGPQEVAWLLKQDIQPLDIVMFPSTIPIHLIRAEENLNSIRIVMPMDRLIPMDVNLESDFIRLRLFGALSSCDFVHYSGAVMEQGLKQIIWRQINQEVMEIDILLDSPLYGFRRYYDPDLKLLTCYIKTERSVRLSDFVLAIDPGHGGREIGATAPDGTPEKELNLNMALKLQNNLSKRDGLQVILTRNSDETVSLEERIKRAVDAQANLLLSLHHNALPDGRDPLNERGVATFYYYPFALPFAKRFQKALVQGTEFQDYGILYDSLNICRTAEMPSLLLELGFLTHPEDAELVLSEKHQERIVKAITSLIELGSISSCHYSH